MVYFGFNLFREHSRDSLLDDVIYVLVARLEFDSIASLLPSAFAGFFVRTLTCFLLYSIRTL